MGLNMCIENRKRECKFFENKLENNFGSKYKKYNKDGLLVAETFQSCMIYKKNNNITNTKKKIRRYERKIKKLKSEL